MSTARPAGNAAAGTEPAAPGESEANRNKPWHRRPTITPNFGTRRKIGLKSSVGKVLLHDNVSQQKLLRTQLSNLQLERGRSSKLLELHRKSFLVQQATKQRQLRSTGITHVSLLPDAVVGALGVRKSPATAGGVNKDVTFKLPAGDGPRGGRSPESDGDPGRAGADPDGIPAPGSTVLQTRSCSATEPSASGRRFLTHDYRLRRERTAAGPLAAGGRDPALQRDARRRPLRALKDPRFVSLRNSLVPCARPVDGYLQLSASGQYVLQRYGTPTVDQERIQNLIRQMTAIRQSRQGCRYALSPGCSADQRRDSRIDRLVISHDGVDQLTKVEGD